MKPVQYESKHLFSCSEFDIFFIKKAKFPFNPFPFLIVLYTNDFIVCPSSVCQFTLVNVYVDLVVFTRIAGTS